MRKLALVLVMSGCVFGSHKSRYIQNGVTAGVGALVMTAPLWDPQPGGNEGQGVGNSIGTGLAIVVGSVLLVLAGTGFTFTALDTTPDTVAPPPPTGEQLEMYRQASVAARHGHCDVAIALARQLVNAASSFYTTDVAANPDIARCLRAAP